MVSGDDEPKRDDFGERRKKYQKWVLAGTGIKTEDNNNEDKDACEQAKNLRPTKRAAKAETYSTDLRKSSVPSLPEETVDGKRHITSQVLLLDLSCFHSNCLYVSGNTKVLTWSPMCCRC